MSLASCCLRPGNFAQAEAASAQVIGTPVFFLSQASGWGAWAIAAMAGGILSGLQRQVLLSVSLARKWLGMPEQLLPQLGQFQPSHGSKNPGNKHLFCFPDQEAPRDTCVVTASAGVISPGPRQ